jgi:ABC-type transport system involved in multi-copper enzyme maturation permease subunit
MWATYWSALEETGHRRLIVILIGIAMLTTLFFNRSVGFDRTADGVDVIYIGRDLNPYSNRGPYELAVPLVLGQEMSVAGMVWLLLTLVSASVLLVETLERGWIELIFSKGTRRWQILVGRFLCSATLFYLMAFITAAPVAARLWWKTGVPTWQFVVAALIQTLSFASVLSVAALATLPQKGVALPILSAVGVLSLSPLLLGREETYYEYIKSEFLRRVLDWIYYIMPKCTELDRVAVGFLQNSAVQTSWPLWTTGLFTLSTLVLTLWLLERKSF